MTSPAQSNPATAEASFIEIYRAIENGDLQTARKIGHNVTQYFPSTAAAWAEFARVELLAGDQSVSEYLTRRAVLLSPLNALAAVVRQFALFDSGDSHSIQIGLRRVGLYLSPHLGAPYSSLVDRLAQFKIAVLSDTGGADTGADTAAAAILTPNAAAPYIEMSNQLQKAGELDKAMTQSERAATLAPGSAGAWERLGRALGRTGASQRRTRAWQRAQCLTPSADGRLFSAATGIADRSLAERIAGYIDPAIMFPSTRPRGAEKAVPGLCISIMNKAASTFIVRNISAYLNCLRTWPSIGYHLVPGLVQRCAKIGHPVFGDFLPSEENLSVLRSAGLTTIVVVRNPWAAALSNTRFIAEPGQRFAAFDPDAHLNTAFRTGIEFITSWQRQEETEPNTVTFLKYEDFEIDNIEFLTRVLTIAGYRPSIDAVAKVVNVLKTSASKTGKYNYRKERTRESAPDTDLSNLVPNTEETAYLRQLGYEAP